MTLGSSAMAQLQRAASGFDAGNPHYARMLREAQGAVRRRGEPLDALALLGALRDSGSSGRSSEREALDAAIQWTSQRLRQDPALEAQRLLDEIGWLLRLIRIEARAVMRARTGRPGRGEAGRGARDGGPSRRSGDSARGPAGAASGRGGAGGAGRAQPGGRGGRAAGSAHGPSLDRVIDQLREARSRAQARAAEAPRPASGGSSPSGPVPGARSAPEPTPPPTLPERFEAELAQVQEARAIRRAARKRQREGRPPKDVPMGLRPLDPALRGLSISASLVSTAGLETVFEHMDARAGQAVTFRVESWERRGDDASARATRVVVLEDATAGA